MLEELSIKKFAIINDLHISLSNGLSVLSGETGAGKSIIINAINLILGGRASSKLIRTGYDSAELEALFKIDLESNVAKLMRENDLDPEEGLLIRRIISRSNRHKIFINGSMSTIGMLSKITENLASISGQHAHQGLLKEDYHLQVLDQFGSLFPLRAQVSEIYSEIIPLIQKLKSLNNKKEKQAQHIELLNFQKNEILEAEIKSNEDGELEKEREKLLHSEALYEAVFNSIEELYNAQGSIIERMVKVKKNVEKATNIDPDLNEKAKRFDESIVNIEDITEDLRSYLAGINTDEKRLETVEDRLHLLKNLKKKYGGSLESVLHHLESIDKELSNIESLGDQIIETEKQLIQLHEKLVDRAKKLSEKREVNSKILSEKVENELKELKMPNTVFTVSLSIIPDENNTNSYLSCEGNLITESGMDRAQFMMAPNVGETIKPLASIASGGELSRVVLALKAILADVESVSTVIFDEVDSGIGGSVAEVVGKKIASLAKHHQILCITHLPQIAKFGNHHFRISKQIVNERTETSIVPINEEERIQEIARMLGGVKITQTTLDHAREMIEG